jgi:protein SCO1/2
MIARACAWIVCAGALCAYAHVGPHPEAGVGFDQHPGAQVPLDAAFADASGARTTLGAAIDGRPSVLVLGYAACKDLCTTTLPGVAEALDRAGLVPGVDYRAVFASIDAREGPAVLDAFASRIPAADRGGWRFLGGDAGSVRRVADAVGFRYRYEPEHDAFAHAAGLVVLTPRGHVSRYLFGVRFEPAQLRAALSEAKGDGIGALTSRLVLLCYHFDPATGRYTNAILDGLRALIAACAIAAMLFAWRGLRRRGALP